MTEQILIDATDTPSSVPVKKELSSTETSEPVPCALLRRTLSNKLHVPTLPPPSPSTVASTTPILAIAPSTPVPEITSVTQPNPTEESHVVSTASATTTEAISDPPTTVGNEMRRALLAEIRLYRQMTTHHDDDSFDDEDETLGADSMYSISSISPFESVAMPCPICLESAVLHPSPCCAFSYCQTCWSGHMSATINDGRIQIPCVTSDCNKYLPRELIIDTIRHDKTLHARYLKLYSNLNQNPRSKTCPRCSLMYSLDAPGSVETSVEKEKKKSSKSYEKKLPKQVQCSTCSLVWCFRCQAPWHENMTCKQFVKGDKLLHKWTKQKNEEQWNARKCPKCSSFIQRAGGCPHMTCRSCACEFCYLCGRRYVKIPLIGQHGNRFSVFGCPYNLHPEKPWLRRTIRGTIATGIAVASPVLLVGAAAAAAVLLPSVGIYRLARRIRARRVLRRLQSMTNTELDITDDDEAGIRRDYARAMLPPGLDADEFESIFGAQLEEIRRLANMETNSEPDFPLAIFADMDVENLFNDTVDDHSHAAATDFRTCPNTPAVLRRVHFSRSLDDLVSTPATAIPRHVFLDT